ncbi:4Fe-4S cluster-binding domain-containing protein [bacterium]|nr:4Fe-4S cluster-binding domain-containing protein [bacterium]
MKNTLNCNICPHKCNVNRVDTLGFCQAPAQLKINLAQLHFGEEPFLVGKKGSGTVFFSHCNLHCCYCQNYQISALGKGEIVSETQLIETLFSLKEQGAVNINLVSPSPYSELLIPVLMKAKSLGLDLPIVWNTNSYESVDTLRELEGLVDIYLADFRYWDDDNSLAYSGVKDYRQVASLAIKEMVRQTGSLKLDEGLAWMGTMIRILVLPNNITGTTSILEWIADNLGTSMMISLMSQYYPTYKSREYPQLNRNISHEEYSRAVADLERLGFSNYLLQELNPSADWTPDFH